MGGGFLAGAFGVYWFGASWAGRVGGSEEMLTVTFQNSSRSGRRAPGERRETGFGGWVRADVFGTRQEYGLAFRSGTEVTSQDKISIELESLILAQNERWRQA